MVGLVYVVCFLCCVCGVCVCVGVWVFVCLCVCVCVCVCESSVLFVLSMWQRGATSVCVFHCVNQGLDLCYTLCVVCVWGGSNYFILVTEITVK